MTRMGADGYSNAGTTQVSLKANTELKKQFKACCEENGETMSDVLEQAMQEYVSVQGDGQADELPDNDQLATAYQALRSICDPQTNLIPVDKARPHVAQEVGIPKEHVRRTVWEPLRREGWIAPNAGMLTVRDPSEVDQ